MRLDTLVTAVSAAAMAGVVVLTRKREAYHNGNLVFKGVWEFWV